MMRLLVLPISLSVLLLSPARGFCSAADDKCGEAIQRDADPPRMTLYIPVPLGVPGVSAQETGVFVPDGYRAGDDVDVILFLRGYDIKRPKAATSVREYWGSPDHPVLKSFLFREEVNKSGRNVVLVIPALGPTSEAGTLVAEGGAKAFLGRVLDGLWRDGPNVGRPARPKLRCLVLAAHSGGGVPLRKLAKALGDDEEFKKKLKACWGFDSTYGVRDKDADFWGDWAAAHPGVDVSMFYLFTERDVGKNPARPVGPGNPFDHRVPSGTAGPALELERLAAARKLDNVSVVRGTATTTLRHNDVPRAFLADRLKAAPYLNAR